MGATSWKTSILGIIFGLAQALLPLLKAGQYDPTVLIPAAGLALMGLYAKDWNVTGTGAK
jgi:hypothetical protein